jgi:peptidylprolyl isomerase
MALFAAAAVPHPKPPASAARTPSGLATQVLRKGTGAEHPRVEDLVQVHYQGWTAEGRVFDSSVDRKQPTWFPLDNVLPGLVEGMRLMVVGEKRRLWLPAALGYGDKTASPERPGGPLVYEVELLAIQSRRPPPTPPDLKAPPRGAKQTASGLSYVVLKKGTGRKHPEEESVVEVHYSGWTPDGKLFDSTIVRGRPMDVLLERAMPGWTEGVQLMVPGQKNRFWIPANLAHGEKSTRPDYPSGNLVFDIELLAIKAGRFEGERD